MLLVHELIVNLLTICLGFCQKLFCLVASVYIPRQYTVLQFLSRVSVLTRDTDIAILSCLSVCPLRSGIVWKRLNII